VKHDADRLASGLVELVGVLQHHDPEVGAALYRLLADRVETIVAELRRDLIAGAGGR
jgi:hypothetical protein